MENKNFRLKNEPDFFIWKKNVPGFLQKVVYWLSD